MAGSENRGAGETLALMRQILDEHEKKPHGTVSRKDVINCNAFWGIRKLLPHNLKIDVVSTDFLGPPVRTYCIERTIHILRCPVTRVQYAYPGYPSGYDPGWWWCQPRSGRSFRAGDDLISLLAYLQSGNFLNEYADSLDAAQVQRLAALCQEGAFEQTSLAYVIEKLRMDPERPTLKMPPVPEGWVQSEWAYPSTRKPWELASDPRSGVMLHHSPDFLPFMRKPSSRFDVCDEKGRVQAVVASWNAAWGGNVMASVIPCHRKDDPGKQQWVVGHSVRKLAPFGLEIVKDFPGATVVVDDDLHIVKVVNDRLREKLATPPFVLVGWPRCMFGMKPDDIDWTALGGRKVVFAVSDDEECFRHGLAFGGAISAVEAKSVEFALPKKWDDGHETLRIDPEKGHLEAELVSWHRFQEIANDRFGLSAAGGASAGRSAGWTLGDPLPDGAGPPSYLLEPVIPEGSAVLLYSAPGFGKSWVALLMAYAIASGSEVLDGRWRAPAARKCLYLATEQQGQMVTRLNTIDNSLACDANGRVTVYPDPDKPHHPMNLEEEEAWERIGEMVAVADFIVIDHLTNATNGTNGARNWRNVWRFIEPLKKSGKSFLILHHTGSNDKMRGTSIMPADVDMKIRIDQVDGFPCAARISFEKHRDDVRQGRDLTPFNFFWKMDDERGTFRWSVEEPKEEKGKTHDSSGARPLQIDEAALEASFGSGREALIVKVLAEGQLSQREDTSSLLAVRLDVSSNTVLALLKPLMNDGLVERKGKGKATHYLLTEKALKAVTRR